MSLVVQYVIVAAAALLSAWVVVKKQFPHATRRLCVAIAVPLLRDGRPPWMRALARRIAPSAAVSARACGGCDSCGPSPKA